MEFAYLTLAVVFNVAAYVVFKLISPRSHDSVWLGLFGFGLLLGAINVGFFTAALKKLNLSVAYPVFSGASIAAIVLVSAAAFSEEFKLLNAVGALLVVAGIAALTR